MNEVDGSTSDGYHTFDELYHHRMILFSVICNQHKKESWKSKKHDDGTMYDNYFIVGITAADGDYTYHYHMDNWYYFNVKELPFAPHWDGHKPEDITRLLSINKTKKCFPLTHDYKREWDKEALSRIGDGANVFFKYKCTKCGITKWKG